MALVCRHASKGRVGLLAFAFCLVSFPDSAHAHTASAGLGEFWSGALHPLISPTHVMIILGLGLLCGRRVPIQFERPAMAFAAVSALALASTSTGWIQAVYPPVMMALSLALGVLLALDKDPPLPILAAIFAVAALGLGLDSAVENGSATTIAMTLLGTWVSLSLLTVDASAFVSFGHNLPWLRIAIQIAGGWIIAISVLMLAFFLRN